jgi:hypothetical protein
MSKAYPPSINLKDCVEATNYDISIISKLDSNEQLQLTAREQGDLTTAFKNILELRELPTRRFEKYKPILLRLSLTTIKEISHHPQLPGVLEKIPNLIEALFLDRAFKILFIQTPKKYQVAYYTEKKHPYNIRNEELTDEDIEKLLLLSCNTEPLNTLFECYLKNFPIRYSNLAQLIHSLDNLVRIFDRYSPRFDPPSNSLLTTMSVFFAKLESKAKELPTTGEYEKAIQNITRLKEETFKIFHQKSFHNIHLPQRQFISPTYIPNIKNYTSPYPNLKQQKPFSRSTY